MGIEVISDVLNRSTEDKYENNKSIIIVYNKEQKIVNF